MKRKTWTFTLKITVPGQTPQKALERLSRVVDKKAVLRHEVVSCINDYTGGQYFCHKMLEAEKHAGKA